VNLYQMIQPTHWPNNKKVNVIAINRVERMGMLDTDEIFAFVKLYDEFGDECDEIDEKGFAIAQLANGG
jgi:predicted neuraminidase